MYFFTISIVSWPRDRGDNLEGTPELIESSGGCVTQSMRGNALLRETAPEPMVLFEIRVSVDPSDGGMHLR